MSERKSSLSQAASYQAIGEFWDQHELTEFWHETRAAAFDVDIQSEVTYYPLDKALSQRLAETARERGVSAETLLNLWVQEKLRDRSAVAS